MKKILYLAFVFVVLAITGMANAAIIGTYVDADDSNTDASSDPLDPWMGTSTDPVVLDTDNLWTYRNDLVADFMENGGVWTGQAPVSEDPVELKTTLTGLTAGVSYNIGIIFAGHNADNTNWNIGAGFASGSLSQFVLNDGISMPTGKENGDIVQLQARVGTAIADANGAIEVYIDRMDAGGRSWYDGLSYETLRGIVGTYVDASESNTVASAGGDWIGTSTDPVVLDTDNLWTYRNDSVADFMENGGVWTGQAPSAEDPVELKTTITGLVAGTSYDIGVVFAGHGAADWNIGAGFTSGDLRQFTFDDGASKQTGKANGPIVQLQTRVGMATADANGEIEVYIDRMDAGDRSWYDGLSYTPIQGMTGTYVDADDSNTDASAGGEWIGITGDTDTDNLWAYRSDFTDVMEGGGVWTGQSPTEEDPVELKTTITGLTAGASYDIGVVFAGRADEGTGSATWWNIAAGFESGGLSEFSYFSDNTMLTGKTAQDGVVVQIQAEIGRAVADANGEIAVYIDRADLSGRSWYDGLTYELASSPMVAGDANNDGKVDGSDVTILAGNWQKGVSDGQTASWAEGDFNGDGKVDGSDVTILAGNWQYGVTAAAAAVPEPSTALGLICLGLTLLTGIARRRA